MQKKIVKAVLPTDGQSDGLAINNSLETHYEVRGNKQKSPPLNPRLNAKARVQLAKYEVQLLEKKQEAVTAEWEYRLKGLSLAALIIAALTALVFSFVHQILVVFGLLFGVGMSYMFFMTMQMVIKNKMEVGKAFQIFTFGISYQVLQLIVALFFTMPTVLDGDKREVAFGSISNSISKAGVSTGMSMGDWGIAVLLFLLIAGTIYSLLSKK